MVIDIIDMNDEQFQDLTNVQMAMVRAAQTEKNKILAEAAEDKQKRFLAMLSRNVARSTALRDVCSAVDAEAQRQIDVVKEDLLYHLAYEGAYSGGNENGPYRYPENPNYQLSYPQRFLAVREYYMGVTSDPQARLDAYAMDTLARAYLGEYYQTLYELLASYI